MIKNAYNYIPSEEKGPRSTVESRDSLIIDTSGECGLMLKVEIIHSACGNVVETELVSMDDSSWEGFC